MPVRSASTQVSLPALVARVARGDEGALRRLYVVTSRRAFGLALRILRNRADAEAALSQAYLRVWSEASRTPRSLRSVDAWILSLVRTCSVERLRSSASRVLQEESPLVSEERRFQECSPEEEEGGSPWSVGIPLCDRSIPSCGVA